MEGLKGCTVAVDQVEASSASTGIGHYRWTIAALLFFATTINYVDRGVLSVLAPMLQRVVGWNEIQYSNIVSAFTFAYALGLLVAGSFIDRVGTRLGYAIVITVWSLAAMGHAWVRSVLGLGLARFLLGIGESGSFPAAVKTVAEWFPKKERALATGIFNSGTNVGPTIAPIIVPWLALKFGWQSAFLITGLAGFPWLIVWLFLYRRPQEHPRVSASELAHINSDMPDPEVKIPWARLLPHRQTWALVTGKVLSDPIWFFLLFWLPPFLYRQYGVAMNHIGLPLFVVYNVAFLGSIVGGWLPARFLARGWSLNRARKTTLLICALVVAPVMFATRVHSLWATVALISMAAAGHQGWSANVWTLTSDVFPRKAIASIAGIAGFSSAMASVAFQKATGYILQYTGSYSSIFIVGGLAYITALALIQSLMPRLEPAKME
jgi:ACS family hexuronate transporter-like MFS transporter